MFGPYREILDTYKNLIIGGIIIMLLVGLYFYIHGLKSQISDLQSMIKDKQVEIANYKLEKERLHNILNEQSANIKALEVDKQQALKKLNKWKALPPKIKYKTITKIREIHSDECKDIKKQLDAIRHLDFNSL